MNDSDRSVDLPQDVTDAIKEAFVVEESEDEDELFARVSLFMKERQARTPDRGEFARASTNLSELGVVTIDAGSVVLAERILVRRA